MIPGERYVVLGLGSGAVRLVQRPRRSPRRAESHRVPQIGERRETRVRLTSGRSFSALLVDGGLPSVDRDLLDEARRSGVAVFVVADARVMRDWDALGATGVLPRDFSVEDLITALDGMTKAIPRGVADATASRSPFGRGAVDSSP